VTDAGELLRSLPYFESLPDQQLEGLAIASEEVTFAPGDPVIREGEAGDAMYVVLEGELEVTKLSEGRQVVLSRVAPGEVQGEMALLEDSPRAATVTALTDARLLRVPVATFRDLVEDPRFLLSILKTVIRRLRSTEATLRHEERMAALGKMAAQLMHELNNPAAAVGRSAEALVEAYARLGDAAIRLAGVRIDRLTGPTGETPRSPLAGADREDELGEWLERLGVPDHWELAASLAGDRWTTQDLDLLVEGQSRETAAALAEWVGLRGLAGQLIREVRVGASRISELVRVVKGYSFLDQAPIQEIDIRTGIDDTLLLLRHKLDGVDVVVDYADDLPAIEAPGRDLNQVWTNLIDNAAQALANTGELRIRAETVNDGVAVSIANTGPPIPDDVLPRIFDPFFTTKEPGAGTGLGLHTVHTIVNRIGGDVEVSSGDDGTVFTVRLPLGGG
jgi:signal transduction histidine kinase